LRRQASGGSASAGSSRGLRLDPHALPVRYHASDARADGATRTVELYSDRVLVERTVRGIPMRLKVPVTGFLGVSVRRVAEPEGCEAVAVTLEHRDPGLSILLARSAQEDAVAEWRRWADALARPLLVAGPDGALYTVSDSIGALMVRAANTRRRRRTSMKSRGPRFAARRATPRTVGNPIIHREREIIAPE
jgi:uncharacterized protein DUF6101